MMLLPELRRHDLFQSFFPLLQVSIDRFWAQQLVGSLAITWQNMQITSGPNETRKCLHTWNFTQRTFRKKVTVAVNTECHITGSTVQTALRTLGRELTWTEFCSKCNFFVCLLCLQKKRPMQRLWNHSSLSSKWD